CAPCLLGPAALWLLSLWWEMLPRVRRPTQGPSSKAGFCPRVNSDMMSICLVQCSSDSDCEGNGKCCSMACHSFSFPAAKPGVCPKRRLRYTLLPCNSTCRDDSDCPGRDKCCFTGCKLGDTVSNNNFAA
uniref:WAP domain-containing protein n=1 Tax=Anas platyrhynchos platyrhynchos TaxID=8840 RepID=U3I6T1_ANAPP